jgi:hypothetical protein
VYLNAVPGVSHQPQLGSEQKVSAEAEGGCTQEERNQFSPRVAVVLTSHQAVAAAVELAALESSVIGPLQARLQVAVVVEEAHEPSLTHPLHPSHGEEEGEGEESQQGQRQQLGQEAQQAQ